MAFRYYFYLKNSISFIAVLSLCHVRFSSAVKSGYWLPDSGLEVSDINSTLFTHLFCAFADLNNQTYQLTVPSECSTFPQTVRQKNPAVKALLSIGGGTPILTSEFNTMASQNRSRKAFIDSSISLAISNGYHGLDLDWEQQSTDEEMNNLAVLLYEWRAAIEANSMSTRGQPLILTAALHFSPNMYTGATFPTRAISESLDWVNVMAYDFYAAAWSPRPYLTRPHAALYDPSSSVSASSGISDWIQAGVPANKLVLGLPFYGHVWKLANRNNTGILAPSKGEDDSVGQEGSISYKDIKGLINRNGSTVVYNSTYVTNYCYLGTTWIVYDDIQTITTKIAYAKKTALLGYFAWNINQDLNWTLSTQASQTWESIASGDVGREATLGLSKKTILILLVMMYYLA